MKEINEFAKIVAVNSKIPEFDSYNEIYFEERTKGKDPLAIIAYVDDKPTGYIVGYNRDDDKSFYCWMAGVIPEYRKQGVLTLLIEYEDKVVKDRGYNKIKIKTRNNRREMISYLVKYGFYFTEVESKPNIEDNRIMLEKEI